MEVSPHHVVCTAIVLALKGKVREKEFERFLGAKKIATQDMGLTHGSHSSPLLPTGLDLAFSALIPVAPCTWIPRPGASWQLLHSGGTALFHSPGNTGGQLIPGGRSRDAPQPGPKVTSA